MVQLLARATGTLFDHHFRRAELPAETPNLTRLQLVERIISLNTTATEEYLDTFSERSLERYLAHLESAGQPRGGRWERIGETPAIVARETEF